jgi:flavorubredoxin
MAQELYKDAHHQCLMFTDLCARDHDAVPSNQFLIIDGDAAAIIDPGGNMAFNELYLGVGRHLSPQRVTALIASHADPDIIASLDRWMTTTTAPLYISKIWERFAPHFCKPGKTAQRVLGIPDAGMHIPVGHSKLIALPAHFLHAEGNFHFYDPIAKILFSGDLGASFGPALEGVKAIEQLTPAVIASMEEFHRRYMVSRKILQMWARMVKPMEIRMIVPQHGVPMVGAAVGQFIDWVSQLECGVDLMGQHHYMVP